MTDAGLESEGGAGDGAPRCGGSEGLGKGPGCAGAAVGARGGAGGADGLQCARSMWGPLAFVSQPLLV
jgi:hypothetical protein